MLHLAFGERVLLADEMGLGKTIQAIAACALLHHLGQAQRCLVVTPASLKAEWEEQIRKFTTLTQRLIYGPRSARAKYYADSSPPFFTITNYEQIVADSLDYIATELEKAVKGMLPKGPLGYAMIKKLKVYGGAEHPHTAQQPKVLEI